MDWARQLLTRVISLFRKRKLDAELDDELRFHLEMEEQQNIRNGMDSAEARRQARLRLGGVEQVKEEYRERRGIPLVESLLQDLRFAYRSFRKSAGLTATALLTLSLSIGSGTAIFSIVHALLFAPPPYGEPERLVMVRSFNEEKSAGLSETDKRGMSLLEVLDWNEKSSVFESMVAFEGWRMPVVGPGSPEELFVYAVSEGFLDTTGVRPFLGRGFRSDEARPGGNNQVVLLSHEYWQRAFRADPSVIGSELRVGINRDKAVVPYTIVGVMPPGFKFYRREVEAIVPLFWGTEQRGRRSQNVMARLKPGFSLEQTQQSASLFAEALANEYPDSNKGWQVKLVAVAEDASAAVRPALLALLAAVGFVLLIACSNVAALLMVRLNARRRELALRCALGASRRRVLRQVVTENLALAMIGGLMGLGLAWLLVGQVRTLIPGTSSFARFLLGLEAIEISAPVALFALAATVASSILFGLLPAWAAATGAPNAPLQESGHGATVSRCGRRWSDAVIAAEVALAVVLVVAAGLLARSFAGLFERDLGFDSSNVAYVSLPRVHFDAVNRLRQGTNSREELMAREFQWLVQRNREVLEAVRSIPGVESAGVGGLLVGEGSGSFAPVSRKGQPSEFESDAPRAYWGIVDADCLRTLRVPVLRGRLFNEFDTGESPAAVINEALAQRLWPDQDPIGREITAWGSMTFPVVGVIGNVKHAGIRNPELPAFFWNAAQEPSKNLGLVVRSNRAASDLVPEVRRIASEADPTLVFRYAFTVEDTLLQSEWRLQYSLILLGALSAIALVLALIGVYGTLSHVVGQRTREIALRMTLGASRGEILRMIYRQGLSVVVGGTVVGLAVAAGATRAIESLLFGVQPVDALTFALVAFVVVGAAGLASYFPARRAAKIDPMAALRCE